ncbi:MAG: hypothetical protein ACR2KV_04080 [Solirubrobacteraceae bacterium]
MRTRAIQAAAAAVLATLLSGCGLFGVKGPGLGPVITSSVDAKCTAPPYELPPTCALGGIGAALQIFKDSHAYVGSTTVIPGSTNYVNVQTSMGRVTSFDEQYHADPPLSDHEARFVSRGEVPHDGRKLFIKTVDHKCQVVEYTSKALRKMYGKQFSAVLIVLRSTDPALFDKKAVSMASISLTAPHSAGTITSC